MITASDWAVLEAGIKQRVKALNLFLWDVYHERHILKDGMLPAELVFGNTNFARRWSITIRRPAPMFTSPAPT